MVSSIYIMSAVVDDYGLKTVQEYMYHIRANAEMSVRNLLRDVAKRAGSNVLESVDYLDDGSPVRGKIISCCCVVLIPPFIDPTQSRDQRERRFRPFRFLGDRMRGSRQSQRSYICRPLCRDLLHARHAGHGHSIERWMSCSTH